MIKRTAELDTFELTRLRRFADYTENLVILEDMYQFAREMRAFDRPRPPEDLKPDIRYARAINGLRPASPDRSHP
jgi:hypothetical protein